MSIVQQITGEKCPSCGGFDEIFATGCCAYCDWQKVPRVETGYHIEITYYCPFCAEEGKTNSLASDDPMECKACHKVWINEVDV